MWPNGNFRNHKTLISDYENYEYGATESIWLTVAIRKKSHRRIFFLPTGKNPNSQEVAKRFKKHRPREKLSRVSQYIIPAISSQDCRISVRSR